MAETQTAGQNWFPTLNFLSIWNMKNCSVGSFMRMEQLVIIYRKQWSYTFTFVQMHYTVMRKQELTFLLCSLYSCFSAVLIKICISLLPITDTNLSNFNDDSWINTKTTLKIFYYILSTTIWTIYWLLNRAST